MSNDDAFAPPRESRALENHEAPLPRNQREICVCGRDALDGPCEELGVYVDGDGASYYVVGSIEAALRLNGRLRKAGHEQACAFGPYGEEEYRVYPEP